MPAYDFYVDFYIYLSKVQMICRFLSVWLENINLEGNYMVDFIVNVFAEVADFFINFWVDNIIDKFTNR